MLSTYGVPRASFALWRQGKLVCDRALGHADRAAGVHIGFLVHDGRVLAVQRQVVAR